MALNSCGICVLKKSSCCSLLGCLNLHQKATRATPTESPPGNVQRTGTATVSHPVATSSPPHKNRSRRGQELTVHRLEAPLQAQDLVAGQAFLATTRPQTLELQT